MNREALWQAELHSLVNTNFPVTRISFSYLKGRARIRCQALFALLASIEKCHYGASDSRVTAAKLGWWAEELKLARMGGGTHPLSIQLHHLGMLQAWTEPMLARLFGMAMQRIEAPGLNSATELDDLCERMGLIHLELESAISGMAIHATDSVRFLATINGQLQLIRESLWSERSEFFWIPLSVCARLGLDRKEMSEGMIRGCSQGWSSMAAIMLGKQKNAFEPGKILAEDLPPGWVQKNLHWLLFSLLQERQLTRLAQEKVEGGESLSISRKLSQTRVSDAWVAWRMARNFK